MLVVALAVLVSTVFGGHRYFYCEHRHAASFDACCAHAPAPQDSNASSGPTLERSPCCTTDVLATAAPGVSARGQPSLQAPLTAVVPALAACRAPRVVARTHRGRFARGGPSAPDPREHRLRLMVSLT